MTNADRIRIASDEEMADMIDEATRPCYGCQNKVNCDECWLDWLQSEAE